jgi:hypothetical protein
VKISHAFCAERFPFSYMISVSGVSWQFELPFLKLRSPAHSNRKKTEKILSALKNASRKTLYCDPFRLPDRNIICGLTLNYNDVSNTRRILYIIIIKNIILIKMIKLLFVES